jgi:O-antigen ligase
MAQAAAMRVVVLAEEDRPALKARVAAVLGKVIFGGLLSLIVLTAIPYGTSHPWWIAGFVCAVFALAILWLVEGYLSQSWFSGSGFVVLPLVALAIFSLLQTVQLSNAAQNSIGTVPWNAISTDPFQTRVFVVELVSLTLAGVFGFRYASSQKRMRLSINLVIGVAVVSALFGILRQTAQHSAGFGLPLLTVDSGYAQFINKNHFAFLIEMGLGLALGLVLGSGVKRERTLIYFALLLPLWTSVVLSGSRGGLVALVAQLVIAALLYGVVVNKGRSIERPSRLLKITSAWPVRVALVLALVAGIALGTVWVGGDRLARTIEESSKQLAEDTTDLRQGVSRGEIWKATCKIFVAHPFLGVGMGAYWTAVPAYHDASGLLTPQEAHNDYLELLASGGLVGFGLVAWFAVIVIKRTRENLSSPDRFRRAACFGSTIGIAGVAIHSLLDFGLHTTVNALVFTTLIVIATSKPQWASRPARLYE